MEAAQLQSLSAVAAVSSVITVSALERIPEEYKRQSFFGQYDLWLYVPVYDEKLCPKCEAFAHLQVFRGNELRRPDCFPHLEISDEDKILARVHPNCRCELYRVVSFERYLRLLEKLEEREKEVSPLYKIEKLPPIIDRSTKKYGEPNLKRLLNPIPAKHFEGITKITLADGFRGNIVGQYEAGGTVNGQKTGEIRLATTIFHDEKRARNVLYHEIGHHVERQLIDKGQFEDWFDFYTENKDKMPNDYARTNYSEGFAECYSDYQRGVSIPEITEWFQKHEYKREET